MSSVCTETYIYRGGVTSTIHHDMQASDMQLPYESTRKLQGEHELAREESLKEFDKAPKLGGERLSEPRRHKLAEEIDEMYRQCSRDNDRKKAGNEYACVTAYCNRVKLM